jgi:hypothetical protein
MTRIFALLSAGAAFAALNAAPAATMPLSSLQQAAPTDLTQVYHRGRPHRRAQITVYGDGGYDVPGYSNYVPDYSYYYPPVRGFGDRSNVWRGNMRGCTVDLGYGRYESCDK